MLPYRLGGGSLEQVDIGYASIEMGGSGWASLRVIAAEGRVYLKRRVRSSQRSHLLFAMLGSFTAGLSLTFHSLWPLRPALDLHAIPLPPPTNRPLVCREARREESF
jgi:hypothetical protein